MPGDGWIGVSGACRRQETDLATVTWHVGQSPDDLWAGLITETPRARVVIHVAAATGNVRLIRDTARSLMSHLRRRDPTCAIDVVETGANPADWTSCGVIDLSVEPRVRVDAVRLRAGAWIPVFWLDPVFLITVCGAAPDRRYGVSAVLPAQAQLLAAGTEQDVDLIYEAHRLIAPDLNVVCGTVDFRDATSPTWWAGSANDLALEASVARAAGTIPAKLPHLRHLGRHEVVDLRSSTVGDPPSLRRFVARRAEVRFRRMVLTGAYLLRSLRADVLAAGANFRRVPQFVLRRFGGATV
jgi:hypothetical protein